MGVIKDAAESKLMAATTAIATGGSSTAQLFGFIPSDIGKLGVLLGAILSLTLIVTHIRKTIIDYRVGRLEIAKLERELRKLREEHSNDVSD